MIEYVGRCVNTALLLYLTTDSFECIVHTYRAIGLAFSFKYHTSTIEPHENKIILRSNYRNEDALSCAFNMYSHHMPIRNGLF